MSVDLIPIQEPIKFASMDAQHAGGTGLVAALAFQDGDNVGSLEVVETILFRLVVFNHDRG